MGMYLLSNRLFPFRLTLNTVLPKVTLPPKPKLTKV
jgi:hypothetical protein